MAKKKSPSRQLTVLKRSNVSPHMLRITFGGPGLQDFPDDQDSAYIKLLMTDPPEDSGERPVVRTYTVRHYDAEAHELDVDFVLHDSEGPAANWAKNCVPGDTIKVMGPGPTKLVDYTADWFLLVGDMSAIPAISANIEGMPDDAKGCAILEIIEEADRQDIRAPAGLDIQWVINPQPEVPNERLLDAVKAQEWPSGRPSIWVAGEFSAALGVRSHLKKERGVSRKDMYASSYWQMGKSEDEHRVSKRNAADD